MRSFIPQEGGLSNLAFSRSLFAFLSVAVVIVGMGFLVNSPGCKTSVIGPDSLLADTTSHSFVWRVDTLGDGNSSVLFDVSILNVNDIWCVGQIFLKDSLGQFDPQMYNAAHWDGTLWNLLRISVRDFGGNTGIFTLRSVRAFSGSDVWFVSDADLIHWDGASFQGEAFFAQSLPFDGQVRYLYGDNANDLYCVGRSGSVFHVASNGWQSVPSGTSIDLIDMFRANDHLWIAGCASDYSKSILLVGDGTIWTISWDSSVASSQPYSGSVQSVWGPASDSVVVVGGGSVYRQRYDGSGIARKEQIDLGNYATRVRGQSSNDIVIVGYGGMLWHFNGNSWKRANSLSDSNHIFLSVAIRGDIIVAVGADYNVAVPPRGLVAIGTRK